VLGDSTETCPDSAVAIPDTGVYPSAVQHLTEDARKSDRQK
jgi:hypothetical protein